MTLVKARILPIVLAERCHVGEPRIDESIVECFTLIDHSFLERGHDVLREALEVRRHLHLPLLLRRQHIKVVLAVRLDDIVNFRFGLHVSVNIVIFQATQVDNDLLHGFDLFNRLTTPSTARTSACSLRYQLVPLRYLL